MNIRFLFILLGFTPIVMTSCTPDDVPMTGNEQTIQMTDTTNPNPEHQGEDEEIGTND